MTPTTHKSAGALSLLTLALFASPMALAQQSGWYGGANVGRTGAEIDDARIATAMGDRSYSADTFGLRTQVDF